MPTANSGVFEPQVISDIAQALPILREEGAVRIRHAKHDEADHALSVAKRVFGSTLRALPEPARVLEGGEKDRRQLRKSHNDAQPVHTDGFAYGDLYPDYIQLSCVQASVTGGESVLVDGYQVLDRFAADPARAWVAEALTSRAVDQTEEGMQKSVSPIVQKTPGGRVMLRRTLDELGNGPRPSATSSDKARDAEMIRLWIEAIEEASAEAPRFQLQPGETLVVDNYRMLHGREGYSDPARMLWRVWVWSSECLGVPEMQLHSDSRFAGAEGMAGPG